MTAAPLPPTNASIAARRILTRLHDVMAGRAGTQAKLNQIVQTVGEELGSEVCSLYLLRDGELELFATKGLNQTAVHVTRLRLGEGLIGTIVADGETLNLDQAAAHPAFAYRPETGEEVYQGFAGVPIIRRERAIGALAVQNRDSHLYAEVEIETLQTVAMVLAELIVNAALIDDHLIRDAAQIGTGPRRIDALRLVAGMGRGAAIFHQPRVVVEQTVAQDIEAERQRVYSAFAKMREQIDRLANHNEFGTGGEHDEVIETYKMFAYDEGWSRRINEAIDSGLTAEAAIERVQQRMRMRMRQIDDALLRERMHDLEDLSNRLLRIVSGQMGTAASMGLKQDSILVARNLGPAELLEYDNRRLKGVVLEEGSLTAHVIIVARAMGIPVLGRARGALDLIGDGDLLQLDAEAGTLEIRPTDAMIDAFAARLSLALKRRAHFSEMRDKPPVTRDGVHIDLMINAGLRDDMTQLELTGAEGIGLFRTEFQFLVSSTMPQRERQQRLYRDVLDAAGNRPVYFRTVDIGGDKALPYLRDDYEAEENPAMGWRGLRLALERETLMKAQARALIAASAGRKLNVMFPLVSEAWEIVAAKEIFERQRAVAARRGAKLPTSVSYGAMLEVPALAETLDLALPQIDFLSIGTNDLTQFLFAADRAHPKLAERYDWLSPAILRFLARVIREVSASPVSLCICGEMGGRPLEAMALIGLGIRRLSITPAGVGAVKAMLRSLDTRAIEAHMAQLLQRPPQSMRAALRHWAQDNKVDVGL